MSFTGTASQRTYAKIFAQGRFLKSAVLSRFCFCAPRFGCRERKSDRPKTEVFIFGRFSAGFSVAFRAKIFVYFRCNFPEI